MIEREGFTSWDGRTDPKPRGRVFDVWLADLSFIENHQCSAFWSYGLPCSIVAYRVVEP